MEVDVPCFNRMGRVVMSANMTGWIEVLGAGMVHPNVLDMAGVDSKKYGGFAFGVGPIASQCLNMVLTISVISIWMTFAS